MSERFAVVIPALNAENSIEAVVRACRSELPDVVVVDDGSSDRTGSLAASHGAVVLQHPMRRGKGGAMKTGFAWALAHGFDGVIGVDADGQHLPSEIPKLIRCRAETGAEMVIGSRAHLFDQMVPRRRRANAFSTWAIARLSRTGITDSQCGFRLYSARLLRALALRSDGFEMDSEVIVRAGSGRFRRDDDSDRHGICRWDDDELLPAGPGHVENRLGSVLRPFLLAFHRGLEHQLFTTLS